MYFMTLPAWFLHSEKRGIIFYSCSSIAILSVLGSVGNSDVTKSKN